MTIPIHCLRLTCFICFTAAIGLITACGKSDSMVALGTVERDRVILKSTASEIIIAEPVPEGTMVEAGTILVELDKRRQQARVSFAEAERDNAKAAWAKLLNGARIEDIDAAKANVEGAMASTVVADKTYRRAVELNRTHLSTQAALDSALAERDSAEARLKAAQKQLLVLTNGTRKEDLDQAEAIFNGAEAQLTLENYQLSELTITATRAGYLDSLPWHEGERVTVGTTIAVLLAGEHPFARVYIPEPLRARLSPGDSLNVKVDGIDDTLSGRLRWIALQPAFTPYYALNERDRARLVYLAEIDILNRPELPVGIPVEVDLSHLINP